MRLALELALEEADAQAEQDADPEELLTAGDHAVRSAQQRLLEADGKLAAQRHQLILLRRFADEDERAILADGLGGAAAAADHICQRQATMAADAEMLELRAALASARAEAAELRQRASVAERSLARLAASVSHEAGAPAESSLPAAMTRPRPSAEAAAEPEPPLDRTDASSGVARSLGTGAADCRGVVEAIRQARLSADACTRAIVGRALEALSRDLYSGSSHVLSELVQNADDATCDPALHPATLLPCYPLRARPERGRRDVRPRTVAAADM